MPLRALRAAERRLARGLELLDRVLVERRERRAPFVVEVSVPVPDGVRPLGVACRLPQEAHEPPRRLAYLHVCPRLALKAVSHLLAVRSEVALDPTRVVPHEPV